MEKTPSKISKGNSSNFIRFFFVDMSIESTLPFPESRQLDVKVGICKRAIQIMIPMSHVSTKKLPLGEQKGKLSRWRQGHDEWLIQFKWKWEWKWQKPWKLPHLIKTNDQVRNRDETLTGQHMSQSWTKRMIICSIRVFSMLASTSFAEFQ
ncbi:hypothetical protein E3N88_06748 [Mikania micrantha]|uniref:Uncharacterized protein n=1 Tax=Mikania micrantha TaxID=192012 RepID=A0A5N6PQN2_9ASTR|nr:hypothetical protein E3N88_06748 [Mikania micrantha]